MMKSLTLCLTLAAASATLAQTRPALDPGATASITELPTMLILAATMAAVPVMGSVRADPDAELRRLLGDRVAGQPVRCINPRDVTQLQVIDRKAIVYHIGRRILVNQPSSGVDRLREDDIIVTRSVDGQTCERQVVDLIDRGSRIPHGFIILGEFVPYDRPARVR